MKTDEQKKVVSKFMILYWVTFIAILGPMWPTGCRLDSPVRNAAPLKGKKNAVEYCLAKIS